jgi:hypothetical protein
MMHHSTRSGSFKTSWRGSAPIGSLIGPHRRIAPRSIRLRGLGTGDPAAQQALGGAATIATATAGAASTGVLGTAALGLATGPAAPFVIAGIVIAALLAKFIGGGCGQACIDASMAEQIYEAAADNAYALFAAGMVPLAAAVAFMQQMIAAGQQHMAQLGDTKQLRNGSANLTKVINAEIAAAQSLPTPTEVPLDLNAARAKYLSGGGRGTWYPQSLSAADQITDQWVQAAIANPPAGAVDASGNVVGAPGSGSPLALTSSGVSVAGHSFSFAEIAIGLALLFGGFYLIGEI